MLTDPLFSDLSPAISEALTQRGFTTLTPIQQAVLDPAHEGRDLRLFSQTGSGKTVAVGLVLAPELERMAQAHAGEASTGVATPGVVLIAPTRELAAQLGRELSWLYAPLGASVCVVTGGTSYAHELRALKQKPLVLVGTPGRLLDHLDRGSVDPSKVVAAVLDEADQMLDLGFRDELEAILEKLPKERRTHLVAATFSREVRALADRFQAGAIAVEGTSLGDANQDIAHVAHLVRAEERNAAIINLLLLAPNERALIFVRTRDGASELAERLSRVGFRALALSGELEQRERTRAVEAFRSGAITTLVATDVAARGLDIPEVGRVIHADHAGDAETFIHRSGRTGRAGRKGTSIVLVPPAAREFVLRLFRNARVNATWSPVPSPEDVRREADARLSAELANAGEADPQLRALAEELLAKLDPSALVAALLSRARHTGPTQPREVTPIELPKAPPREKLRPRANLAAQTDTPRSFVPFHVSWGGRYGADARRMLALICRRGGIRSDQVGAIHIGDRSSTVEIASPAASDFAREVKRPDARDPRILIRPLEQRSESVPERTPRSSKKPKASFAGGAKPPKRAFQKALSR